MEGFTQNTRGSGIKKLPLIKIDKRCFQLFFPPAKKPALALSDCFPENDLYKLYGSQIFVLSISASFGNVF
jgi:hypothetical protein